MRWPSFPRLVEKLRIVDCLITHNCLVNNVSKISRFVGNTETFVYWTFLQILGTLCQSILLNFGSPYALTLGMSYESFLTAVSSSLTTSTLLTVTYLLSRQSVGLIRSSIFVSHVDNDTIILYLFWYFSNWNSTQ